MTATMRVPKHPRETLCSVHDAETTVRRYNRATGVGRARRNVTPADPIR